MHGCRRGQFANRPHSEYIELLFGDTVRHSAPEKLFRERSDFLKDGLVIQLLDRVFHYMFPENLAVFPDEDVGALRGM